ncbi:hypothetical protein KFL_000980260 [Klebsormidium nitens]|uniref:HPP transmembrane region domain-containing protein n=1 Tax=Klebsormidium nitens TaxID=105231 RepID=A0A0U9HJG5_KLENI|nr:hypothetical protein KFL_000980260 [Klebsormidium nitens]|eukprot:GAQ82039.1 hypothetical protein KFL_000980260 [Klebsormidium nitens]
MAPEAVTPELTLQPAAQNVSTPDTETEQPQRRDSSKLAAPASRRGSRSRRSSWKPRALQNIHHVGLVHYHSVKRSLANLRAAEAPDSKAGFSLNWTVKQYVRKWTGANEGLFPPRPTLRVLFWSWIAAFCGIALLAVLTYNVPWYAPTDEILHEKIHTHLVFIIGSFGASAVLVFGAIDSPLAQPRNLVGGHVLSACVGIAVAEAFDAGGLAYPGHSNKYVWVQAGMAVATAVVLMQFTRTVHPPGGATALIAVTSPPALRLKGLFIVIPVLAGALLLLLVALIINNIQRHYPLYWWSPDVLDVPMEDLTHHTGSGEAFMPHSDSHVGLSIRGGRLNPSLHGGGSLHGGADSTHHSRVSYIDLSVDPSGGGSAHGRRPPGEAFAPVRHHIIQFPMHVLQAEIGATSGGVALEPDIVLDHPRFDLPGKKLVLPRADGKDDVIPPMERVEGWVANDARVPLEQRGLDGRQLERVGPESGGAHNGAQVAPEEAGLRTDTVAPSNSMEAEGQVHGANLVQATTVGDNSVHGTL